MRGEALALPILACLAPSGVRASEHQCEQYVTAKRLPETFEEIAHAQLTRGEFFVLTDQECTCDNRPSLDRLMGKMAMEGVYWACRPATADERGKD